MKVIINERQYLLLIESSEKETKELLIVGDSHSEDIGGYTYSSMIKAAYPGTEIVAERGKSTSWMKKQLEKELGENKYNKVIIWGGTNDLFGGVPSSTAIRNIQEMIDMVNEQGGKAYVVIGYNQETFSKKGGFKKNKEAMEKGRENYLDFQQELPNSIKGATIIPSFDFDTSYVSGDNLHGNIKAHKRVYDIITDYLEKKEDVKKVDVEPEDKKYEEEPKKEKTYSSEASKILKNIQNYIDDGDTFEMYKSKPIPVSEKVRDIQKVLQYLKFSLPEWGADGRFGRETRKAVMSFQDSVGIESNGIVDTETLRDLKDSAEKEDFDSFDTSKLEIEKKSELETVKPSNDLKLSDTGVEVESYPSDLDSKFRDVTGDYYDDFINDCSSIGLDPEVAMKQLYTESRFSPSVVSCKRKSIAGAMGIAQIMPSTWSTYGDGNVCKVEDSLKAYIKIMKDLMKMFPGRLDLAIAGYNSGPWYKDKSTKKEVYKDAYENDIPFKELYNRIPKETFKYASTILQA